MLIFSTLPAIGQGALKGIDTAKPVSQPERVRKVNEIFSPSGKEVRVKKLHIAYALREQQRDDLVFALSFTGVLLLSVIAGMVVINRRRRLKTLEAQALLEQERRNKEDIILLRERELERTRRKAISNLRKKISRDMHDELTSALAGLRYYVNDLRLKETDDGKKFLLNDIEQEVESVYRQARAYMHNLNQGIEEAVGELSPFLQNISKDFAQKKGFDIRLKYDKAEVESRLSPNQQQQLILLLKEATSNILKHAGATIIEIVISFDQSNCYFSISDNGRGFNKNQGEKGLGLESMELRIRRIRGKISTQTSSSGTTVRGSFLLA